MIDTMTISKEQQQAFSGKIPHVYYEYRKNYMIWFANHNQYFKTNESGWFIIEQYNMGRTKDEIRDLLARYIRVSQKEADSYVSGYWAQIKEVAREKKPVETKQKLNIPIKDTLNFIRNIYRIGQTYVKIAYQNEDIKNMLHPLIRHLEYHEKNLFQHTIIIACEQENLYLKVSGKKPEQFQENQTHLLKGRLFMILSNLLHDKSEKDWMLTIHASAVREHNNTMLIPAGSGCGKTTLAAILHKNGYTVISDDFVPVDLQGKAHYFPGALSIKEGAFNLLKNDYPELETTPFQIQSREKMVRYLSLGNVSKEDLIPKPAQKVLFIRYDPNVPCKLKRLVSFEGFSMLLAETYVMPGPEAALAFMKWALNTQYYHLTYSNTELMLQAINSINVND